MGQLRCRGLQEILPDEPSVPTNEFVRKSAMHERVSTMGSWGARGPMSANMRLE